MKTCIPTLLLFVVQVICGQNTNLDCCGSKVVGEFSYTLVETPKEIPSECLNSCAYTRDGEPGIVYCFARGPLPVKCYGEKEVVAANNTCTKGLENADFRESVPSEDWIGRCKSTMEDENLFLNYSKAVAHGIHSMSLQDLRAFFDEEATPVNGIPTANRDLCAEDEDIVLENAPDIPPDFASIGLQTLDVQLQNMDDTNYMDMSGVLQRLVHSFHMHDVWTAAQPHYQAYKNSGPPAGVCECVLDTDENGINQELKNSFFFYRECRGQLFFIEYFEQLQGGCKTTNGLTVTDSKSWEEKKKLIHESMPPEEDIKKLAVFLYCGLKD